MGKKITDLPSATTPLTGAELFECVQSGVSKKVAASAIGGSSYLVYTALLSQSGTDAPVVTILENTIDDDIVWTRLLLGRYNATSANGFATGTVVCPPFDNGGAVTLPIGNNTPIDDFYSMKKTTDTTVILEVVDVDYNLVELSSVTSNSLFIEIRVYL